MRISDARYTRDLRRYQLAWRFIQHGARSRTIERWTGLSKYRIRTVYEEAYAQPTPGHGRPALRGVAPRQISFFWRSAHLRCEGAILAGFLKAFEACPGKSATGAQPPIETLSNGERLCRAYEEFKAFWPEAQSTLEHAILLLTELARGVEIALAPCATCHALIVFDRLSLGPPRCAYCAYESQAGLPFRLTVPKAAEPAPSAPGLPPVEEDLQGSLF